MNELEQERTIFTVHEREHTICAVNEREQTILRYAHFQDLTRKGQEMTENDGNEQENTIHDC